VFGFTPLCPHNAFLVLRKEPQMHCHMCDGPIEKLDAYCPWCGHLTRQGEIWEENKRFWRESDIINQNSKDGVPWDTGLGEVSVVPDVVRTPDITGFIFDLVKAEHERRKQDPEWEVLCSECETYITKGWRGYTVCSCGKRWKGRP
jgi:hypothetical protein